MITGQFSKQLASIIGSLQDGATEFEIRYRRPKGNPCIAGEPYLVVKDKKETRKKMTKEEIAEEYAEENKQFDWESFDDNKKELKQAFLAGYNKANEWHYPSKGEYPDNDNDILCQIDFETFEVGYFNEMYNNIFTIDGREIKVKAWKEIVLPELPKESE